MLARMSKEVIYQLTLRRSHQLWELLCRRHSSTARTDDTLPRLPVGLRLCRLHGALFFFVPLGSRMEFVSPGRDPTRRPLMQLLFRGPVPTAKGVGLCNTTRARPGPIPSAVSSSWPCILARSMASRGCSRSLYHPPVWSFSGNEAALPVDPDTNRPPK